MRSLRYALAVLACVMLFVVCSGCGSLPTKIPPRVEAAAIVAVHVFIEPSFTDREYANIINGILLWERATNGAVTWQVSPFDSSSPPTFPRFQLFDGREHRYVLFRRASGDEAWVQKWDSDNSRLLLGQCVGDPTKELATLWLVETRLPNPNAETMIAAHEFGHALGINHVDDTKSVMSELFDSTVRCLTSHDIRAFCNRHGCNFHRMKPSCWS